MRGLVLPGPLQLRRDRLDDGVAQAGPGAVGLVCDVCDEAYLLPESSREIDRVVKEFREGRLLAKPIAAGEVDLKLKMKETA